jgi:hypothetical protein
MVGTVQQTQFFYMFYFLSLTDTLEQALKPLKQCNLEVYVTGSGEDSSPPNQRDTISNSEVE